MNRDRYAIYVVGKDGAPIFLKTYNSKELALKVVGLASTGFAIDLFTGEVLK